jgi:hypothetical protein
MGQGKGGAVENHGGEGTRVEHGRWVPHGEAISGVRMGKEHIVPWHVCSPTDRLG